MNDVHMGIIPKIEDPTNEAFNNEEHGSHSLFLETYPLSLDNKKSWHQLHKNSWHQLLKINIHKFDGLDPMGWVT